MIAKLKLLLSSIRFWQVVLASIAAELALVSANGFQTAELMGVISAFLTAVTAIGTVDRFNAPSKPVEPAQ
jgi:hypothetical protein